jgi:hypothetical protein
MASNSINERYEQKRELGRGSFGTFYLVIDRQDNSKLV